MSKTIVHFLLIVVVFTIINLIGQYISNTYTSGWFSCLVATLIVDTADKIRDYKHFN